MNKKQKRVPQKENKFGVLYYPKSNIVMYEGFLKNNLKDGYGTLFFTNGLKIYQGLFKKNLKDDFGTEYNVMGNIVYKGKWKNNLYHGRGSLYSSGKLRYMGNFSEGEFCSYGYLFYLNGKLKYKGYFLKNKYNKYGYEYTEDGSKLYEGKYKDGKFHGDGKLYFGNNIRQCGNFKNGRLHGFGMEYYYPGTLKYNGIYKNGLYHGKGIYYYYNGNIKYSGYFKNKLFNGKGVLMWENNKTKYEGRFVNGLYEGKGVEFYFNGEKKYEGNFLNGKYEGRGILYDKDGGFKEYIFKNGEIYDKKEIKTIKSEFNINLYLETGKNLEKISKNNLLEYISKNNIKKDNKNYTKSELLELIVNRKRLVKEKLNNSKSYDNFDIFGNEIKIVCLGNDNQEYDLSSMEYLFKKNDKGEYVNISYVYDKNNIRVPNYPVMYNGIQLTDYFIKEDKICDTEL